MEKDIKYLKKIWNIEIKLYDDYLEINENGEHHKFFYKLLSIIKFESNTTYTKALGIILNHNFNFYIKELERKMKKNERKIL